MTMNRRINLTDFPRLNKITYHPHLLKTEENLEKSNYFK